MDSILIRPVISEQSLQNAENGKFTFIVKLSADKDEIKKAVEEKYSVKVLDIASTIVKNKVKRVGKKRTKKTTGSYKKAVIKVQKGQKISEFELGEKK